jgi:threonine synthase
MHFIGETSNKSYNISINQWIGDNNELLHLWFKPKPNPKNFLQKKISLWRYADVLPLKNPLAAISLGETITPLIEVQFNSGLKAKIKQDQLFPTGSYKDRGAAVLMSFLKEHGAKHVIQDSSGNAGAAIAAYAAAGNITCDIFLPANTSQGKITQMQAYGANIIKIEGDRDETARQTLKRAIGQCYASHVFHPVFFQGTKTFAYELVEQLDYECPDAVVLPAGNGTLLLGCYIGFSELYEAGIITKMPKLIAIQSTSVSPIYNQFFGLTQTIYTTKTIAEGIAIAAPKRLSQMLEAVRKTSGTVITVDEHEIVDAWKELASKGFFVEPTSAATIAGLKKYSTSVENSGNIVSLFSGNGLKSTDKIQELLLKS